MKDTKTNPFLEGKYQNVMDSFDELTKSEFNKLADTVIEAESGIIQNEFPSIFSNEDIRNTVEFILMRTAEVVGLPDTEKEFDYFIALCATTVQSLCRKTIIETLYSVQSELNEIKGSKDAKVQIH